MTNSFVSRAGEKLSYALNHFGVAVAGLVCADFGSSTGGFVDCLLKNGAQKVYSVDVSYGELAWKLRNDPRVVVLERTNAMHVKLPELVDLITVDVGFTKQRLVLESCVSNLKSGGRIMSLIKPHYESNARSLKSGKLPDDLIPTILKAVIEDVEKYTELNVVGVTESPITGTRGKNKEFLLFITKK